MNRNYPRLSRLAGWVVLFAAAALAACHKGKIVVAPAVPVNVPPIVAAPPPSPPPAPPPAVEVPPPAPEPPSPSATAWESANKAFSSGDYSEASNKFEEYLRLAPGGDKRDEALFQLGLISALAKGPNRDWTRAAAYLKQLVAEYPQSSRRPVAELILSLRGEVTQLTTDAGKRDQRIRQLTTELERLKQIDADRRKRP